MSLYTNLTTTLFSPSSSTSSSSCWFALWAYFTSRPGGRKENEKRNNSRKRGLARISTASSAICTKCLTLYPPPPSSSSTWLSQGKGPFFRFAASQYNVSLSKLKDGTSVAIPPIDPTPPLRFLNSTYRTTYTKLTGASSSGVYN